MCEAMDLRACATIGQSLRTGYGEKMLLSLLPTPLIPEPTSQSMSADASNCVTVFGFAAVDAAFMEGEFVRIISRQPGVGKSLNANPVLFLLSISGVLCLLIVLGAG